MARRGKVAVSITADPSGLQKGLRKGEQDLNRFGRSGAKSLSALKVAAISAGAAITGGLVIGLKSSVDAAIESEKSNAKLQAQLKALGISYRAHAKEIDAVIRKTQQLSGLDDEDLQDAFTNVVRATGNVNVALKDMALVADIARARHMDVAKAGDLVAKAHNGSAMAFKRLGVAVEPVTKAQDALKASTAKATDEQVRAAKATDKAATAQNAINEATRKYSGQAEKYGKTTAGSIERFQQNVQNLQESIGTTLLPTLTTLADKASKFVDEMQRGTGAGGRFAAKLKDIGNRIKPIAEFFKDHPALIAVAVGAWVTYRVAAVTAVAATRLKLIGTFVGLSGPAAAAGATSGTAFGRAFAARAIPLIAAAVAAKEILEGEVDTSQGTTPGQKYVSPTAAARAVRRGQIPGITTKTPGYSDKAQEYLQGGGKLLPRKKGGAKAKTSSVRASPMASTARASGGGGTNMQIAQGIASRFGLRVTNGYRTPEHNARVGGVANSDHMKGSPSNPGAVDMVGSPAAMQQAASYAQSMGISTLIHDAGSGLHLHLSFAGGGGGSAAVSSGLASGVTATAASAPTTSPSERLMNRFGMATEVIGLRESAGVFNSTQAARAVIKATTPYLSKANRKILGVRDRLSIVAARREAQRTIKQNAASSRQRARDAAQTKKEKETDWFANAKEYDRAYGGSSFTDAALAMAQTDTAGTADDLAVYRGRLGLAQSYYSAAKETGREDDIVYWAQQVRDNTQAITDLTTATADQTARLQEQLDLQKQATADAQKLYNASQAQYGAWVKGISDAMSGQVGGDVGLRSMTPSYAGGGSRY